MSSDAPAAQLPTIVDVPFVPNPQKTDHLTVLLAREALRRARPLPSSTDIAIDGFTDEEWEAFDAAIKGC